MCLVIYECVCVYVDVYMYTYVYMHKCVSVCRCIYVYVRGRVRVNVCISNDQTPHENPIKYQLKKVLEAYHLTKTVYNLPWGNI